jgi:predicted Zn-ribbon and HTH transcriptional regulator
MAHAHPSPDGRAPQRPALEVADIVRAHGEAFARAHVLTPDQHAVLRAIARCRTAVLGGHVDVCDACGYSANSYNSCRNRHCPKCQALAQARWIEGRMKHLLPTHSFHAVFTIPSELHGLAMTNREVVFGWIFTAAAETLLELGRDPKRLGAELGITSVLHTWTRELLFHPHVHCIVTGGGLSLNGERWVSTRPDFLFHVRVIGALFRGKFMDLLVRAYDKGELRLQGPAAPLADPRRFARLRDKLYRMRWVVYAKPPFGGPEQVFRYLGRYTHRVGLSNQRLVSLDERGVTFRTHGANTVTVKPDEFLRRFVLHVLPKGFVKIRHYGLMAPSNLATKLAAARRLLGGVAASEPQGPQAPRSFEELLLALTGTDVRRCPRCDGTMTRHPLPTSDEDLPAPSNAPPDTS